MEKRISEIFNTNIGTLDSHKQNKRKESRKEGREDRRKKRGKERE